jgi:exonuclease SbcC
MIIKKLTLQNFRSYSHEELELPKGIILFEGDVGSGKSSILYAIEFALFGLGDMRGESLLRAGEKQGTVEIVFEINGKQYRVKRSLLKRKKSVSQTEGFIEIDGNKEYLTPSELKERILQILGFKENPRPKASSVIFRYAVFTPQEEMKEILRLKDEERLQTLRKAFGIEDYKIIKDNVKLILSELRSKIDFISGELVDFDEIKKELEQIKKKISEYEKNKMSFESQYKMLQEKLKEINSKLDELNEIKILLNKLLAEIPLIKNSINEKIKERSIIINEKEVILNDIEKLESEL